MDAPEPGHTLDPLEPDSCDFGFLEYWQESEFKLEPTAAHTSGMDQLSDHFLAGGMLQQQPHAGGGQQFGQLGLSAAADPYSNQGLAMLPALNDQHFQVQRGSWPLHTCYERDAFDEILD